MRHGINRQTCAESRDERAPIHWKRHWASLKRPAR
jgi:hypothetical protein